MSTIDLYPAPDVVSFERIRPRLFGIAYRIVRSRATADDLVQDTWVRWQQSDRDEIRDASAFLATITTRLAINLVQSAHTRHETCAGPSFPERADAAADPALGAEQAEALGQAVRLLLEKLSPTERAVFLLREAFEYPYQRIAGLLGLSELNARQLGLRARRRLGGERRAVVAAPDRQRLLDAVISAARDGHVAALEELLVADIAGARGA